jgi:hypothetical protein
MLFPAISRHYQRRYILAEIGLYLVLAESPSPIILGFSRNIDARG